jgi:tRNA-2-methylthio-N6-dimethylallyladenosine synthase
MNRHVCLFPSQLMSGSLIMADAMQSAVADNGQAVFIKTWGCQMNEYDSARMAEALQAGGMALVEQPDLADAVVFNTCSVREKAQEKLFDELGRYRAWKKEKPGRLLAVGGCVASQEGEGILRRAPFVDVVFGPQTLHRLPAMLHRAWQGNTTPAVDIHAEDLEKFEYGQGGLPVHATAHAASALVSIMEGCSKSCSFCIVPYTRGEEVSRPLQSVVDEVHRLVVQGAAEITLLGQNVNSYRGALSDGGLANFPLLLHHVAALPGLRRLRFTTSHPLSFSEELIDTFSQLPQLAQHVHLPVQSGSDRILQAMGRGHDVATYRHRITALRKVRPGISISSDFIVGYPGETEADFLATLALVDELGIDQGFSFLYSPRPGTPAAALEDPVPLDEKKRRLWRLQDRLHDHGARFQERLVGTRDVVLLDRRDEEHPAWMMGRTSTNRMIRIPAGPELLGQWVEVGVVAYRQGLLMGELMHEPVARAV